MEKKVDVLVVGGGPVEKVRELGDLAEKYCLVSRSVACPVHYHLEIG